MDENLPSEWARTVMERFRHNFAETLTGSWDGERLEELYRSPVEMGWARAIKFDHEFIGRQALEEEVANPRRRVVTIAFDSDDLVRVYASLFSDDDAYQLFEIPQTPLTGFHRCRAQHSGYGRDGALGRSRQASDRAQGCRPTGSLQAGRPSPRPHEA